MPSRSKSVERKAAALELATGGCRAKVVGIRWRAAGGPEAGAVADRAATSMKERILFVEDDPILLQTYTLMMGQEADQWDVTTAEDGQKALALMERKTFDVIVSDKDPGMTAKLLQIVNSVMFGLARKVSNPLDAIQHLDPRTVRSVLLSAHIFSSFDHTRHPAFSASRLLVHALRCGLLAQVIMQRERADTADIEDAYIAGMLHDIGKLMLAENLPRQFHQAITLAADRAIPLHEAELEVLGATHAGVGAYLLGLWGLPASTVEAVAFHPAPLESDHRVFGPLTAVHTANALEQELSAILPEGQRARLDEAYIAALRLGDRLETSRTQTAKVLRREED